jgi:hypothetical protein
MEIMRASTVRNYSNDYKKKRIERFEKTLDIDKINANFIRAAETGEKSITMPLDEEWEYEALIYFRNLGYLATYAAGHLLLTW